MLRDRCSDLAVGTWMVFLNRTRSDWLWRPPIPLYNECRYSPGVKMAGEGVLTPPPHLVSRFRAGKHITLYCPSVGSWTVVENIFPLDHCWYMRRVAGAASGDIVCEPENFDWTMCCHGSPIELRRDVLRNTKIAPGSNTAPRRWLVLGSTTCTYTERVLTHNATFTPTIHKLNNLPQH